MPEKAAISKRDVILKAAAEVFALKGFYGAKIEDIALCAGIGKGTVYEYFRSKEELFNELIKAGIEYYKEILEQEISKVETSRDKLECLIRVNVEFSQKYRLLAKIVMLENIPMDNSFRTWLLELHIRHLGTIEDIIKKGISQKEIRPIDASLFALLFYGGTGIIGNPFIGKEFSEDEIKKTAQKIIEYYFEGIQ